MSCRYCDQNDPQNWFWAKIGRCQRCINQLTVLALFSWGIWWFLFRDTPRSVHAITTFMFSSVFTALLFLHLWMKWVILPLRKRNGKEVDESIDFNNE